MLSIPRTMLVAAFAAGESVRIVGSVSALTNGRFSATPLLVKQDGTREEFDRDKLIRGIRISCAKRPVSAADIDRLVGEIESTLQALGRSEVSSRVVGDMVIAGLKEPGSNCLHSLCHRLPWPGRLKVHPQRDRPYPGKLTQFITPRVPAPGEVRLSAGPFYP